MRPRLALLAASVLPLVSACGPSLGDAGGGAGGADVPQGGEAAIARCEQSISTAPQLSPKVKSELEDVCRDAARGDQKGVRDATRQVCERIVEESVPAGAARRQALSSCRQGP